MRTSTMPGIRSARFPSEAEGVRALLRAYQAAIGVDLCFQNFEAELAGLPGAYAEPRGALLVAEAGGHLVGCVGMRPLDQEACEMKRLFVTSPWRGTGLGRALAERIVAEARARGYRTMKLDTLPSMTAAQPLYHSLGFRDIPPHDGHPVPGTVYLGLDL